MKLKKSTKIWIIVGSVIVALGLTFVIMLFCTQKGREVHVFLDPVKDCQKVLELMAEDSGKAEEYLNWIDREYADTLDKKEFKALLEKAMSSKEEPVSGDPQKDAETFCNLVFSLMDENNESMHETSKKYYVRLKNDSLYADPGKFDEFRAALDLMLNNADSSFEQLQEFGFIPQDEK